MKKNNCQHGDVNQQMTVYNAWNQLREEAANLRYKTHILVRSLVSSHHLFQVLLDTEYDIPSLGIMFPSMTIPNPNLPASEGIKLEWCFIPGTKSHQRGLMLVCECKEHLDMFFTIANDFHIHLSEIENVENAINTAVHRFSLWRDCIRNVKSISNMSEKKQKGLFGELRTLETAIMQTSPRVALNSWLGPYNDSQDFHFTLFHIETKLTESHKEPYVVICDNQFIVPNGKSLFLNTIRVERNSLHGETIKDVINRIKQQLIAFPELEAQFEQKLALYGYQSNRDNEYHFSILAEQYFHIKEPFPILKHEAYRRIKEMELLIDYLERNNFEISGEAVWGLLKPADAV